jgi:hypothetical protein
MAEARISRRRNDEDGKADEKYTSRQTSEDPFPIHARRIIQGGCAMIDGTHLTAFYIGIIIGMIAGAIYGWLIRDEQR